MPISKTSLISEFGALVEARSAALFVGAGISVGAGLPSWSDIATILRDRAGIPSEVRDASLVAEYFAMKEGGHGALDSVLLHLLTQRQPTTTPALAALAKLPVLEFWTTNYDTLIEDHLPSAGTVVVSDDADYARKRGIRADRRVIKIHGNIAPANQFGARSWTSPPVMTRSDFERYPQEHPILWRVLQAGYLSRSMLFLGISFDDPNIHVLQALSRAIPTSRGGPPHYAVMRVPDLKEDIDLWQWRRDDLENSGVRVCEISDFSELDGICSDLARRSRPRQIFVGGSWRSVPNPDAAKELAKATGFGIAQLAPDLAVHSLSGTAAIDLASGMRTAMTQREYSPDRIVFHYRRKPGVPSPSLPQRMGTCVYWDEEVEDLRQKILSQCRAVLVLGGGDWTEQEVQLANAQGLPVIPLAATGGTADRVWRSSDCHQMCGLQDSEAKELWKRLGEPGMAGTSAALRLLSRVTFVDDRSPTVDL